MSIAGRFAEARERGVEPQHEALADKVQRLANENGKMNTDFHYAYELVDILERISDKTFVLDAPSIVGRAEPQTLDLLQEATRCYLFGLHRACLAICRTVLEDSLEQRVPQSKLRQSRKAVLLERGSPCRHLASMPTGRSSSLGPWTRPALSTAA